ncbi:MAG: AraC family transcriptional regulator [Stenomitos rutilans HA7619-LM2]|jgi:AraC family transcriptional regulator|nr:AraC family transcriptional regulator [Stenomitos rutilans HA7619-LM2]
MQFNLMQRKWNGISIDYGQMFEVGEFDAAMPQEGVAVAFAPHDRVVWSMDGGDRQTTAMPPGSVFLYASRRFVWHQREKPSEWIHITFDPQLISRMAVESGLPADTQLNHRVLFLDPTILHIAHLLKAEVLNGGLSGDLFVESLRNVLLIHLLRHYSQAASIKTVETRLSLPQIHAVKTYIENHLAESLSIANLAAIVPMSEFHFARSFKAATGESPHRYVTQRRIERAKIFLSVTQLSVAEISDRVGFSNQSHFTAQFRKLTGTTPRGYRTSV